MSENKQFKNSLIKFNNLKQKLEKEKAVFALDVKYFMRNKGIPVKIQFFGDTFGLDIVLNIRNISDTPRKIPLDVVTDFCNEFGCEFEYTNCNGERYIFSFNGLSMEFNL